MTADIALDPSTRPIWQKARGPFILLLILIAFFWKLLLTNQYSWLQSPDLAYQVLPWFDFQARTFHAGSFALWDPLMFGGQSLIGQDQPGAAYPLNWILFALPLRGGHINIHYLNWYYMSIHYFAALFCYWLCRDLGKGEMASVAGGLAFGLGGYVGNVDWPQMINGAIWGPLVFLFLFRAARGARPYASAALCGVFLGVSWLSGHHQVPIFLTLATGGVWLFHLFGTGRIRRELLGTVALFGLFFLLAGAFQMWPTWSYGHSAVRWVGSQNDPVNWKQPVPYTVHRLYSLRPKYLLGILIAGFDNGITPYTGFVALALAGLALARNWRLPEIRVMSAVGVVGLFLALGDSDVFHGILYSILPVFEKARTPSTAIYLFHFAIAVLLAFGMEEFMKAENRDIVRRMALIAVSAGSVMFFIVFGVFIAKGQVWNGDDRVMITVLAALAFGGLAYRMSRGGAARYGVATLVIALYLMELGNSTLYYLPNEEEKDRNVYLSYYDETASIAAFLRKQPGPVRVWVNRDDVPFNFGDWYGIDTLTGYVASLPVNFFNLETYTARGRQLFGTAYTISRKPLFSDQTEVFRDPNGLAVYRNSDVLPHAWTVHSAVVAKNSPAAQRQLQDPAFDPRTQAFMYTPAPAMDTCTGDTVQSFSRTVNGSKAVVTMACRGMLVMSENNASGWSATIDGAKAPIYDAYTTLRGVIVPAGTHTVKMQYRPVSALAGAFATLLAFLGAAGLWFLSPKSRPEAAAPVPPQ